MYYKVTTEELTEILNELAKKPWGIVNNTIQKLLKLDKVEEKLEETIKEDK